LPAPKSSRSSSSGSGRAAKSAASGSTGSGTVKKSTAAKPARGPAVKAVKAVKAAGKSGGKSTGKAAAQGSSRTATKTKRRTPANPSAAEANVTELLLTRVSKQLDLVMLTRGRIQETLDEAAERGRVTRTDANMLVAELVKRGRQQTDDLVKDVEELIGRGRGQLESATRRARNTDSVDRIVRGADRARRTVGVGSSFPIPGYDELSAAQVQERLDGLRAPELRNVRDYERRHANRKTVLEAVERALA